MKILRYAPFLLLGPVTGPLSAIAVAAVARRRWGMAALAVSGIVAFWVAGPMILAAEVALIRR